MKPQPSVIRLRKQLHRMKIIFVTAVVLLSIGLSAAQTYLRGNARDPETPGKCFYKEKAAYINVGEFYKPVEDEACHQLKCLEDYVLEFHNCPKYNPKPGCTEVVGDLSKTFPDCCVHFSCVGADGATTVTNTAAGYNVD